MTRPEPAPEKFNFSAVSWLPPFRLDVRALFADELEVTQTPTAALPFARLRPDQDRLRFEPLGSAEAARLAEQRSVSELQAMLDRVPAGDLSMEARTQRWIGGAAIAAAAATAALPRLGGVAGWLKAAAERRAGYLRTIDQGSPPSARQVGAALHQVPRCLRGLGDALPTAEAVALLAPLRALCELGAGFGLFARALERAGISVEASDLGTGGGIGIGFPVRRGVHGVAEAARLAGSQDPPPLLMVWPQPDASDWFARVFGVVRSGQLVAMASPEFEFCAQGGPAAVLARDGDEAAAMPGPGWRAAVELVDRLRVDFEEVGQAPVVAGGWPMVMTPLRLWRRK
jgi:hypothetical protein